MEKIKVAFIGIKALPGVAGVDIIVEKIATTIDHDRFEVTAYVSNREVPPDRVIPNVKLVRVPTVPGKFTNATIIFLMAALHAFFLGNYNIIHLHSVETGFVIPLLRLRYRIVATAHGLVSAFPDEVNHWGKARLFFKACEYPFMYLSNARTSVSLPDRDFLSERYNRDVQYIPNGITLPQLKCDEARAFLSRHGLVPGNYLIFVAGRNIPVKGCHFVLEALKNLDINTPLLVLGNPDFDPEYNEQLRQMADERVRFGGFISDKALLFALIKLSCLFVFPSVREAMANALLEGAALKTPLLASDLPSNLAVLPTQALYFKSADVSDLQAKMAWALAHPREMHDLAARAEEEIRTHFQWPMIIDHYEGLYYEVLK